VGDSRRSRAVDDVAADVSAGRVQLLPGCFAVWRGECGWTAISDACERSVAIGRHFGAHAWGFLRCRHAFISFCRNSRALGLEQESGALRLLVQMPYRSSTLVTAKLAAILEAWLLSSILGAGHVAIIWGHLSAPETLNLLFGHLLYGLLVGRCLLPRFRKVLRRRDRYARLHDSSWVLDFTVAGHPGLLEKVASLSLTRVLRTFEQGQLSVGLVLDLGTAVCGFAALAARLAAAGH
jgi:hypothetical protein